MSLDYLNPLGDPWIKGKLIEVKDRPKVLDYCVYLPPDYDEDSKYPILYHLHAAGAIFAWMKREVMWTAAELEKQDVKMIIAAPADPTLESMWVDGNNIDIAKQFHRVFIPEIESTYSVMSGRSSRFVQGFSMGGFGAALHGFKYQDRFGKVIVWDGEFQDWESLMQTRRHIAKNQFAFEEENFDLWSPWAAAKAAAEIGKIKVTPILMFSGATAETRKSTLKYKQMLVTHGAVLTFVETKFSHSLKPYMAAHGKQAVDFLTNVLPADVQLVH